MTENTPLFLHEKPKNTPIFHLYNVFTGSYTAFPKLSVNPYSEEIISHNIEGKKYQIRLLNVPLYAVEFLPKILSTDHLIV